MSTGGGPLFGSGGYFGGSASNPGNQGGGSPGGMGGLPGMGGMGFPGMGGMGFPGMGGQGPMRSMGPRGPFGCWPSCGCSSIFIILAGILLVFGGCLRMLNQ